MNNIMRKQFASVRKMTGVIPEKERFNYSIKDIKAGGYFRISGKVYLVEEISSYREFDENFTKKRDYSWNELKLFCINTGETINVEWEEDDVLEVSLTTVKLKFKDIRDDENGEIDEDDLDQISKEEDSLFYGKKEFSYDDDYAAKFYRGDDKEGDKVYFYDFEAKDGTCLTIEEWGDDESGYKYEIYLSSMVDPADIEVLALQGN